MPKIIMNLQSTLLAKAKALLLEKGYRALNMRDVANGCGIAVGTLYNYYDSKEALVSSVLLADWNEDLANTETALSKASAEIDGLELIFRTIRSFYIRYNLVFDKFGAVRVIPPEVHEKLVGQLSDLIASFRSRFSPCPDEALSRFLAENLIFTACFNGNEFDFIRPFLVKLL